jgi:hypothetical protein
MLAALFSFAVAFADVKAAVVDAAADAVAVDVAAVDAAIAAAADGDVILQTSTSSQAPAIIAATASPYSHVGVVVVEGAGAGRRVFVVEAAGAVRKTPFRQFVNRGLGGRFLMLRHEGVDANVGATIAKMAKRTIGTPYDLAFAPGRKALYCSELVGVAFKDAGVDVGVWQTVGDLHVDNPVAEALLAKRWRKHPACRGAATLAACRAKLDATPILTPAGVRDDPRFVVVADTFP